MVPCKICGVPYKFISPTHLKKHGYTVATYRLEFPDAPLVSDEVKEITGARTREWLRTERGKTHLAEISVRLRGRPLLQSTKDKLSAAQKRNWEDPQVRATFVRGLKAYRQRPGVKEGYSDRLKRQWRDPEFREARVREIQDRSRDPQYVERMRLQATEKWRDPRYRDKMRSHYRWTKDETALKGELEKVGLYGPQAFDGHVEIGDDQLQFNADFAYVERKLIVHVDGPTHYNPEFHAYPWRSERDRSIDNWCRDRGWRFIRFRDYDIHSRLNYCVGAVITLARQLELFV